MPVPDATDLETGLREALKSTRALRARLSNLLLLAESKSVNGQTRRQIEQAWSCLTEAALHLEYAIEEAQLSPRSAF